jgi:hypothetical protein
MEKFQARVSTTHQFCRRRRQFLHWTSIFLVDSRVTYETDRRLQTRCLVTPRFTTVVANYILRSEISVSNFILA